MKLDKVAKAYARAIIEIANDKKNTIVADIVKISELINSSENLENVLFLELFTVSEKASVFEGIFQKCKIGQEAQNFFNFLLQEGRISLFPLVYKEMVVLEDDSKGFLKGIIEGADNTIDSNLKAQLVKILEKKLNAKPEMTYSQNLSITAGFRATVQDLQIDATIDSQLDILKNASLNN